jgi:NADPH-dependent F420 reductase
VAKVALVGGTGGLGKALCLAWCKDNQVVIGSRRLEKATETLNVVKQRMRELGLSDYSSNLSASTNDEAIKNSSLIVLTIPHDVDEKFILELAPYIQPGSVVVSPVSPITLRGGHFQSILKFKAGAPISFAEWVRDLLGTERVVSTLQTFPASRFYREGPIHCDIPVAGDDHDAVHTTMVYLNQISGVRPVYVGPLTVSLQLELMTPLLLNVQRFSGIRSPAIKFV